MLAEETIQLKEMLAQVGQTKEVIKFKEALLEDMSNMKAIYYDRPDVVQYWDKNMKEINNAFHLAPQRKERA